MKWMYLYIQDLRKTLYQCRDREGAEQLGYTTSPANCSAPSRSRLDCTVFFVSPDIKRLKQSRLLRIYRNCIILLFGMMVHSAYSETISTEADADTEAYCNYITEKNQAKSTLLRSPDAIVLYNNANNIGENFNTNNFQKTVIAGLSKDLIDYKKAYHIDNLITDECRCYKLNQRAKLYIQFAIPSIKAHALRFKLKQIQIVKAKLLTLLATVKQRLNRQHDTLPYYYHLEGSLKTLEDTERQIHVDLASQTLPHLERTNLNHLLKAILNAKTKREKTRLDIEKQNNLSMQLQVGGQQNVSHIQNQNVQPYFAVYVRYNLGAILSNGKREQALSDYTSWQNRQVLGAQKNLAHLIQAFQLMKKAEENRLTLLTRNARSSRQLHQKMTGLDSINASHFKQQLEIDKLMLQIELNDVKYTISKLQEMIG
jgi:hypothetical protein